VSRTPLPGWDSKVRHAGPVGTADGEAWLQGLVEHERRNWVLWLPVAFAAGILGYFSLGFEPGFPLALLVFAGGLSLATLPLRGTLATVFVAGIIAASSGFLAAKVRTEFVRAPALTQPLGPVNVSGVVELIEAKANERHRITLAVRRIDGLEPDATPARVRYSTSHPVAALGPGSTITVALALSPPPQPAAPGDHDFARYAWFKQIGAVGYATATATADANPSETTMAQRLMAGLAGVRKHIGDRVRAVLPGETGAIANALITGERGAISEATNEAFRASGLYHILSISGLHMAIMAGAVFFAVRFALALIPPLALRYPIKKWSALAAILGAFAYLMISGGAFPTVRSFLMISVMFVAILIDRPALALRNVALSALLILIIWPESILDPGFQMSFAAVVALVAGYEAGAALLKRWRGPHDADRPHLLLRPLLMLAGIAFSTVLASAAVAPFALYHFNQTQHYAVLANALAMPVCNLIVMPAALATLLFMPLGLEAAPLAAMGAGLDVMRLSADWVANLPGAVGHHPSIAPTGFALAVAGGLILCLVSHEVRWLGLVVMVSGAGLAPTRQAPDVLISSDGATIAARGSDGRLYAIPERGDDYTLARWLERDGDAREPDDAKTPGHWRCDPLGCTIAASGMIIAVPSHPAALADDCGMARLLVIRRSGLGRCQRSSDASHALPATPRVIEAEDMQRGGAHAIYVKGDGAETGPRIVTARSRRGDRPWTLPINVVETEEAG